ncbi:DEAD/DEAH box helicase [Solimonas marina]|nr:DEAD/DEAH box helicase [Solimonas marina]
MSDESATPVETSLSFRDLALRPEVLAALDAVGYETPSPIQAQTIPQLLDGHDVLGMAQTGTGKTAAFALPVLSRIELVKRPPQALVLAPTRELAIQVAEAFQRYAANLPGFHVLPIYGGQAYGPQLAALRRGPQVIVGTPGRMLDHLKRGTLDLSEVRYLVLDEADEMLKMGFVEDIEAILQATPDSRQVALFSATMPPPIRRIAQTYLHEPVEVRIAAKTTTAANVRQRYWLVAGVNKLDALTRILEAESFDGMIVFVRTKAETVELADRLMARGFTAAALNGDMEQKARERVIAKLKSEEIDIVVATDIAARGIDVERVSHVVNYDIPTDPESYVHRIGRTGRAGRSGEAILFVAPRERHLLRLIERVTRQPVTPMELPSAATVNEQRLSRFKQKITEALAGDGLDPFRQLVAEYEQEQGVPALEIAAALGRLLQGDTPLLLDARPPPPPADPFTRQSSPRGNARPRREDFAPAAFRRPDTLATTTAEAARESPRPPKRERPARSEPEAGMQTYRIAVGYAHQVKPGNIVGAIANEAGLDSQHIGRVEIFDDYSLVDLPEGMPKNIFRDLQKVWVCGQQLRIAPASDEDAAARASKPVFAKKPFDKRPSDKKSFESKGGGFKKPGFVKKADGKPGFKKGGGFGKPGVGGGRPGGKPKRG